MLFALQSSTSRGCKVKPLKFLKRQKKASEKPLKLNGMAKHLEY